MGTTDVIVKVMHPHIKVDYMVSSFFLRLVGGVFFRGVNVDEFLTNVRAQYDYNNEARNLKTMYDFYKDDKVVIIPRLIMHSKTIIVMTYEGGIDYSEISHEVLKQKVALSILAFQRQNSAVYGYIHADLHDGNWKVRVKNDSKFNLIIYDFGLITKTEPAVMAKWAKAYQYQDFEQLVNIALEHSDGKYDKEIMDEIIDNCKVLVNPKSGMLRTLKVIIPLMRRYNIKMKDNFLSTLVSFALTENILSNLDRGTICIDTHNGYVSNCLDLIAFCESRNTCRLLQKQLEEDIETVPLTKMFTRSESIIDSFDLDDFYNETMSSELS
jgi:predicted unusual protein kinase regulating ubiquinone biosynthesis (AarF/ABC1/UbiB family)